MSGDVTIGALKRESFLPERQDRHQGNLIGGQDYFNVFFMGGSISNVTLSNVTIVGENPVTFTPLPTQPYVRGKLYYDTDNESLSFFNNDSNISLQIGQEEWIRVINNTGSTIPNGSAVYLNGSSGGLPTVALALASASATTIGAGLATEAIASGSIGYITCIGIVHGVDTSSMTAGQTVFISATTAGALTTTAPAAPNYRYRVGIVASSSVNGSIHVTPSTASLGNGTANQISGINTAGTGQEYKTITAGTGITVTPGAGTITISSSAAGTVTSVAVSGGTTGLTTSGGPITSSGTITIAGTLIAANGGTGQSSYAVGDILFASTTTALSKLADVATGNAIISGGVGVAPSYGKIGLTTHVSGTLPLANGGTGGTTQQTAANGVLPAQTGKINLSLVTNGTNVDFTGNTILQRVSTQFTAVATGTTIVPMDDTIPQNTEGDQYMTQAITPLSATSILVIDVLGEFSNSAQVTEAMALFQDTTANALKTTYSLLAGAFIAPIPMRHIMTSGTTSATTFKIRAGGSAAGTTTFNGQSGGRLFGGTSGSYMMITEYAL